jgi:hypothetical protein
MILLPFLLGFFVLVLLIGAVWLVIERGKTKTRRGPEVFQEVFESRMKRQALLSGRPTLFQKTWTKGTGVAWEIEASMSYGEIKAALLLGQYRKAAPGLMIFAGILGTMIFAGLTILLMTSLKIFGALVLGMGVFGTIQCANWFRRAAPAFPTPPGGGPSEDDPEAGLS